MTTPPPPGTSTAPMSLADVRTEAVAADRHRRVVRTGFVALDGALAGGLRTQNLTVLGGRPGAGKTITLLQWARQMALDGETVLVACYEHDERTLLDRLLLVEIGELDDSWTTIDRARARELLAEVSGGREQLSEALDDEPALAAAYEAMQTYEHRVLLLRASGVTTTIDELRHLVRGEEVTVLLVDYLQKVPTSPRHDDDRLRVMEVAQACKELAMTQDIVVVGVSIASRDGLDAPRLHLKHLAGSSTLTYEADAVVLLNDKYDIVHRSHIMYDPEAAKEHRRFVVFTVEKHRDGAEGADLEFRKDFRHYRFDPTGGPIMQKLLDERLGT